MKFLIVESSSFTILIPSSLLGPNIRLIIIIIIIIIIMIIIITVIIIIIIILIITIIIIYYKLSVKNILETHLEFVLSF